MFYFVFEVNFPSTGPQGLIFWGGGGFNGGFLALPIRRAYIWRGVYMEGLIFGILRYIKSNVFKMAVNGVELVYSFKLESCSNYYAGDGKENFTS